MNKVTEKAMDFFYKDDEASKVLKNLLDSGKPCRVIAQELADYIKQLNKFELMAIYHQLEVSVTDATDWDEVANFALCEWYGAHSDNNY
jgi:hypothetical protein